MKILFIHQNFPGQFKFIAPALASRGHEVKALCITTKLELNWQGVEIRKYKVVGDLTAGQNPFLSEIETKLIRASSCFMECMTLKEAGFKPDVIVAHPGWGESLRVKNCWPHSKLINYCEYFYKNKNADVNFDPEFSNGSLDDAFRVEFKNVNNLLNMEVSDFGISPTEWQKSLYPKWYQEKIKVIHDGIDTEICKPNNNAYLKLKKNNKEIKLTKKNKVITFINRNLEPYRGYHIFMRSLAKILSTESDLVVLIIGGDGVSYGFEPEEKKYGAKTWKDIFVNEVKNQISEEQWSRVYFLGNVEYKHYLSILQISTVHVYLTYPFVLSWSLLEAMSVGCAVVASDTAPVKEVIRNNENGLLVDFFQPIEISEAVLTLLNDDSTRQRLSNEARETIRSKYDLNTVCLKEQILFIENIQTH